MYNDIQNGKCKRLFIIGAGGHGKVIANIAQLNGYKDILFFDDDESLTHCGKYKVSGLPSEVERLDGDVIVGIGDSMARQRLCKKYLGRLVTMIHPSSVIADDVEIGIGSVVMAGVVINPGSCIGRGCIINTCASVDHDCRIADFVHVAVGAHLAGTVHVGVNTWIGAGAVVCNNVNICGNCIIGAGTVVVKSVSKRGTYVGMPARKI